MILAPLIEKINTVGSLQLPRMKKIQPILLLLALVAATATTLHANSSPNILILYADDMGYGDLAIQNPESKIPTPNLDRLACEGMRFTDGHSSSGICTPSRYALLTGRHHWRKFHGIVNAFDASVFDSDELTLPEMLKAQGYTTAHIGKWHLGFDWSALLKPGQELAGRRDKKGTPHAAFDWSKKIPDGPTAHGFDYSFTDAVINFPPYTWIENDIVVMAPDTMMDESPWKPIKEGKWECRPGPMVTGWDPYKNIPTLTAKGVKYIEKQKDSETPFFLYFALPSPHAPIIPNDQFDGKSQAGPYGDFMVETDDACGQLLQALEKADKADNTIVIFSADNGSEKYMMQRYLEFDHNSSRPFRGMKRDIWEGGHHVPFLIKWPGVTEPGSVSEALICQVDIMRTLASALGCEIPAGQAKDSFNMLPIIKGEQASVRESLVYNTWANKYGMRRGDWVYLQDTGPWNGEYDEKAGFPKETHQQGLYNLAEDIGQRQNRIEELPDRVKELENLLIQIQKVGYPRVKK